MLSRVRQLLPSRIRELAPREAYRLWAEDYPPYAHNLLMEAEERALVELLPAVRRKRVLRVATGHDFDVELEALRKSAGSP